jgi:indolepyruvate ferredoxin oxidoreductase
MWSPRAQAQSRLLPGSSVFTTAVAHSLFKLMAYKDEYEVARLHTQTGLREKLRDEFDGDFRVKYHLVPPILSAGRDARGRPLKRQFGAWIELLFGMLPRLKFLRGTSLDPFGYRRERQMERGLIAWYDILIAELLPLLRADTLNTLVKIAALPMEIRGYGPVKKAAAHMVQSRIQAMRGANSLFANPSHGQ